jgi:hypothetical protein
MATSGGRAKMASRPAHAIDWRGNDWTPQSNEKAAHPNSRFTTPMRNNPALDSDVEKGEGVPDQRDHISVAGRSDTVPLVYQAFDWEHGVYLGRDDGVGNHRSRHRCRRASAARSNGDAALLRIQHRRLFSALARYRKATHQSAADSST